MIRCKSGLVWVFSVVILSGAMNGRAVSSTVGVATGNKTVDGRPLLFKNKDRTDSYPSDVNFYQGGTGEYSYVFQMNFGQSHTRARMGVNTAGFGIVYSDSENLEGASSGPTGSQLTAIALKTCATIQDFRDLLDSTNGARRAHNHYGVIDSTGSGSLFEVDGYSYVEVPVVDSIGTMANTAKYHPSRGSPAPGSTSPDREARAAYLLTNAPAEGLDYRYFVQEISKDFSHSQEDENSMPVGQYRTNAVLSRYKTATGGVIRGCKPGDNPLIETMMWLALGEPSLSIVLPFSSNAGEVFDFVRPSSLNEGMAGSIDRMRMLVYDYTGGRYADQLADTYMLMDIRALTFPLEDSLFGSYEENLPVWRTMANAEAESAMTGWAYSIQQYTKSEYDNFILLLGTEASDGPEQLSIELYLNYPNPFNAVTTIDYTIPRSGDVSIIVYDVKGREIARLVDKNQSVGTHRVTWDASNVAKGIYFCRLTAGDFVQTRKLVLLR